MFVLTTITASKTILVFGSTYIFGFGKNSLKLINVDLKEHRLCYINIYLLKGFVKLNVYYLVIYKVLLEYR